MPLTLLFDDLLTYTEWQRSAWHEWFRAQPVALAATTGPHTDGRFPSIGALVRHIFSAELRYVERIEGSQLTDLSGVPTTEPEALFALGARSRAGLRTVLTTHEGSFWDTPLDVPLLDRRARLTPRKILVHVATHELRHWAQVATMLRQQGWVVPPQDLLLAPLYGEPLTV